MSHDAHLPGYTIRRPVEGAALLPAVGVGLAAGLAVFYLTRLLLQRQPVLTPEERERRAAALERRTGRRISPLGGEMVGSGDDLDDDVEVDLDAEEERERRPPWSRERA